MKKSDIKKRNFRVLFLCVVLCVLPVFMLTGCSDEAGDRLVDVNFGVDDVASRNVFSSFGSVVAPEDCFWTYTAVKTEGYYTTGASEKNSSGKLIEKRVSDVKGLSGVSRKFSQGKWTFSIFGYSDEDCTQLIYTAEKSNVSFTSASQTVLFTLKNSCESGLTFTTTDIASDADKAFNEKGFLELGHFVLIVPNGITLRIDSSVLAEIFEGTDLVASSYTGIHSDRASNIGLSLSPFTIADGKKQFSAGTHTFTIKVTYTRAPYLDESVEPIIATGIVRVPFVAGGVTNVSGSLSGLTWSLERSLVGGQIFYVGPDNGAKYRFFDCMGRELTTFTVDGLRSAYSYTVEGFTDSMADRFYVCNASLVKSGLNYTHNGGSSFLNYTVADLSYTGDDGKVYKCSNLSGYVYFVQTERYFKDIGDVGCGKSNTEYVMNFKAGHPNPLMNADNHVKSSDTCWYYLANSINKSGSTVNKTGLYDWYVPSASELYYLITNFRSILPSTAGSDTVIAFSSTLTCYPGATITAASSSAGEGCCRLEYMEAGNSVYFNTGWRHNRSGSVAFIRSF